MAKDNKPYRYLVFLKNQGAVPVEGVVSVTRGQHTIEFNNDNYVTLACFDNDAISGWVRQNAEPSEDVPEVPDVL